MLHWSNPQIAKIACVKSQDELIWLLKSYIVNKASHEDFYNAVVKVSN